MFPCSRLSGLHYKHLVSNDQPLIPIKFKQQDKLQHTLAGCTADGKAGAAEIAGVGSTVVASTGVGSAVVAVTATGGVG